MSHREVANFNTPISVSCGDKVSGTELGSPSLTLAVSAQYCWLYCPRNFNAAELDARRKSAAYYYIIGIGAVASVPKGDDCHNAP